MFRFNSEGRVKVDRTQFAIKDWWISDFIAIYNNELATLTVECITDSHVIEFNAKKLDQIHSIFPEFEAYQRKNLERHMVSLHKRILNQLQLTALERYEFFSQSSHRSIDSTLYSHYIA